MRGSPGVTPRGQSEVLGVVLLVGIVLTVSTTVVLAGGAVLEQSQTRASVDSASTSMAEFDREVQQLGTGPGPRSQATIEGLSDEGDLRLQEEGYMLVEIDKGGTETTINRTLGKLVYERDGHEVAYQGGGVWRKAEFSDESAMVSPPEFDYRHQEEETATLTLPIVSVSGSVTGDSVTLANDGGAAPPPPAATGAPRLGAGDDVTVTVQSDYYRAWAEFLRENTQGGVVIDQSDKTVTVTFHGYHNPEDSLEGVGAFSTGSVTEWANGASIDSYDSSENPYARSQSSSAIYNVDDNLQLKNSPSIHGDVQVREKLSINGDPHVHGAVISDGEPGNAKHDWINGSGTPIIEGTFSTQDDLVVDQGHEAQLNGDVIVGGSIEEFDPGVVGGDIHAHDDVTIVSTDGVELQGDIIAAGDVRIDGNTDFTGSDQEIIAGGNVVIENGAIGRHDDVDIKARGDVTVENGNHGVDEVTYGGSTDFGASVSPDPHHASSPISLGRLEDPYEVRIDLPGPVTDEIEATGDRIGDSSGPTVSDVESGDCDPCTLGSGEYHLDSVNLGDGDSLEFDTSSGNITVYVENEVYVKGEISVDGSGSVRMYVNGHTGTRDVTFEGDEAEVIVYEDGDGHDDEDAGQFRIYTRPAAHVAIGAGGSPEFTGVIYGPGPSDGEGTDLYIDNQAEIYGGLVGNLDQFSNDAEIHFDQSLATGRGGGGPGFGPGPAPDGGTVRSLSIETQRVTVGS